MKKYLLLGLVLVLTLVLCAGCQQPSGIVSAEEWEEFFPEVVQSYQENSQMIGTTYGGSAHVDYLETFPYLNKFYEGYVFSYQYDRLRGHVYALHDVENTARPQAAASCYACKTSDYVEMINEQGVEAAGLPFDEVSDQMEHTITCYDCHQDRIAHPDYNRHHLINAIDETVEEIDTSAPEMTCAQCHVEYYMPGPHKEVALPWKLGLGAEQAYQYYENIDFYDWIHPSTGSPLLKAQHPEYETFQGSIHEKADVSCIDCHMPYRDFDGSEYRTHHWTTPLVTVEDSCLSCHEHEGMTEEMMIGMVESLQGDIYEKTQETAYIIEELIDELTLAVESGDYTEEELDEVRQLHRKSQFMWDYVFVENGEGFHHYEKADEWLAIAKEAAEEGLALLSK